MCYRVRFFVWRVVSDMMVGVLLGMLLGIGYSVMYVPASCISANTLRQFLSNKDDLLATKYDSSMSCHWRPLTNCVQCESVQSDSA